MGSRPIFRDKRTALPGRVVGRIAELPDEIDHVEVVIYHMLPSVYVVSLDAFFTDQASRYLGGLPGKVEILDRQKDLTTWSVINWYREIEEVALARMEALRTHVETAVSAFLSGYFRRQPPMAHGCQSRKFIG